MRYIVVVVLVVVSVHLGDGFPNTANQPNPLIERHVSVRGQMQCGGVPAKNVRVALLLVDLENLPDKMRREADGEFKRHNDAAKYEARQQRQWAYGKVDETSVDEDGRYEVGGKVLVSGVDDRRFVFQLSVGHRCKNGTEQATLKRQLVHYTTIDLGLPVPRNTATTTIWRTMSKFVTNRTILIYASGLLHSFFDKCQD